MPLRAAVWGGGPGAAARATRLGEELGPSAAADVRFVPVGGGDGGFPETWPDRLAAGEVDLVLCPLGPALEVRPGAAEVVGMTRRRDPHDVLLGAAGGGVPPEERLGRGGGVVAVPCARSAGLLRARHPGVRVARANGFRRDLARVDRGELVAVIATHGWSGDVRDRERAATVLPLAEWVPSPGSGSLAILVRAGSTGAPARVGRAMVHGETTRAVRAEAAVARALRTVPGRGVGVIALPMPEGLRLLAMVVSEDGRQLVRGRVVARNGTPPAAAAARLVSVLRRRGAGMVGGVAGDEVPWAPTRTHAGSP